MENMANTVARIPNLVDWSTGEIRLMSAKCNSCGTYFFPSLIPAALRILYVCEIDIFIFLSIFVPGTPSRYI